ncbi:hypothetical protein HZ326_28687 [Fusarium oxysporum f. sp. albedinis]|nr:hypothetical protein HZ326_28687 [Fusarium oxysporum f. sp. albedinis]
MRCFEDREPTNRQPGNGKERQLVKMSLCRGCRLSIKKPRRAFSITKPATPDISARCIVSLQFCQEPAMVSYPASPASALPPI